MINLPERVAAINLAQRFLFWQIIRYNEEGIRIEDAKTAAYLDPQSPVLLEASALAEKRPQEIVALAKQLFLDWRDAHLAGFGKGRIKEYAAKDCVTGIPVGLAPSGEPAWLYEPRTRRFWENRGQFWYCEYD
ncbi:MAG: hypothetical protein N3E49_09560 [Bacteroidia bacterium]|nr:hypothetical protein [Bacteroidia bacterium]